MPWPPAAGPSSQSTASISSPNQNHFTSKTAQNSRQNSFKNQPNPNANCAMLTLVLLFVLPFGIGMTLAQQSAQPRPSCREHLLNGNARDGVLPILRCKKKISKNNLIFSVHRALCFGWSAVSHQPVHNLHVFLFKPLSIMHLLANGLMGVKVQQMKQKFTSNNSQWLTVFLLFFISIFSE